MKSALNGNGVLVVIGFACETTGDPMAAILFEDGLKIEGEATVTDLQVSVAILRDMADMMEKLANRRKN